MNRITSKNGFLVCCFSFLDVANGMSIKRGSSLHFRNACTLYVLQNSSVYFTTHNVFVWMLQHKLFSSGYMQVNTTLVHSKPYKIPTVFV